MRKKHLPRSATLVVTVSMMFGLFSEAAPIFEDGGVDLQSVLDGITVAPVLGSSSVDVLADYLPDGTDETWSVPSSRRLLLMIVDENSSEQDSNSFGIYDPAYPQLTVELFDGPASPGNQVELDVAADGSVIVDGSDTGVNFAGNSFGWYFDARAVSLGGLWYSDPALNSDLDGPKDHMAAYQGPGDTLNLVGVGPTVWTSAGHILAFEDFVHGLGEPFIFNYWDFVVLAETVPEPTALAVWSVVLICVAGRGCRFRA